MSAAHVIDRDLPIPYYYQLKQILRKPIEAGQYNPGDRLPGEHELCRTFDVSRTVVRQALDELEVEGLLQRRKGRGTFVAAKKVPEYLFQNFTGLSEDVAARGGTLRSEVWRLEAVPAPDLVAKELGLRDGDTVIVLERLRFVNEVPWVVVTTYLPYELCPQLLEKDMTRQSLYALLEEEYGVLIAYGRRSVEATAAINKVARALGIKDNGPILRLRSTAYDEEGKPIEYFIASHRGDLSRFEVNLLRRRRAGGRDDPPRMPNMVVEAPDSNHQL